MIWIVLVSVFLVLQPAKAFVDCGSTCCPRVGPGGLYLQDRVSTSSSFWCEYGSGSSFTRCVYSLFDGTIGTPGCPPAPANPDVVPCPYKILLHPNHNNKKCLDIRGNIQADGTPVQIYDCNGTGAQNWIVNRERTEVRLAGTKFCLDAGPVPAQGNGVKMQIRTCNGGPSQKWYYSGVNTLSNETGGICLDLPSGDVSNSNQVQIWSCGDPDRPNPNQIWSP